MSLIRTLYLVVSILFLLSLTFCKTHKESTKVNDGKIKSAQTIDKQSLSASSVSDLHTDISPEEIKEMNGLAEKMAVLYCDIKSLEQSLEDSNDNESIQSLNSKKKSLIEYQALADSTYQINSHKARFDQAYMLKKRRCE